MPPSTTGASTSSVLLERMEQLRTDVAELSGRVTMLSDNLRRFELGYTSEHVKLVEQSAAAHRRLDEHDTRIRSLEQTMQAMQLCSSEVTSQVKQMRQILIGLGAMIVPLIVTLVWQLITNQAMLVVPP